jgi:2,3-bisphosphoglycerate-dependent phosphoglycerate mutase
MAFLVLVRHARSEWNAKGLWTGWEDVGLSDHADEEVAALARQLPEIEFHAAYTSTLRRASGTLKKLKENLGLNDLPTIAHEALKERDYGVYTGRNKWEVRDEIGEDAFRRLRRGWDVPVPEGESLKDVYDRVVPYYTNTILPDLEAGKNVLVVAHGNSLRALMRHMENLDDEGIAHAEIGVAEARIYEIDASGRILSIEMHAREGARAV